MEKQLTLLTVLGLFAYGVTPASAQSPWETGTYNNQPSSPSGTPYMQDNGSGGVQDDSVPLNPEAPSVTVTDIPSMTTKDLTPDKQGTVTASTTPGPIQPGTTPPTGTTPASYTPPPKNSASDISAMADKIFLHRSMQAVQNISDAAQLAETKANSNSVRRIARKLSSQFGPIGQQLAAFAAKSDQSVSQSFDPLGKRALADLQSSTDDFDAKFVSLVQKQAADLLYNFQKESGNGGNPDLKNYASQTEPAIQKEVDSLQASNSK